jgi:hypothetical protein
MRSRSDWSPNGVYRGTRGTGGTGCPRYRAGYRDIAVLATPAFAGVFGVGTASTAMFPILVCSRAKYRDAGALIAVLGRAEA